MSNPHAHRSYAQLAHHNIAHYSSSPNYNNGNHQRSQQVHRRNVRIIRCPYDHSPRRRHYTSVHHPLGYESYVSRNYVVQFPIPRDGEEFMAHQNLHQEFRAFPQNYLQPMASTVGVHSEYTNGIYIINLSDRDSVDMFLRADLYKRSYQPMASTNTNGIYLTNLSDRASVEMVLRPRPDLVDNVQGSRYSQATNYQPLPSTGVHSEYKNGIIITNLSDRDSVDRVLRADLYNLHGSRYSQDRTYSHSTNDDELIMDETYVTSDPIELSTSFLEVII